MDANKLREEFHRVLELHSFDYSNPEVVEKGIELEYKLQAINRQNQAV